MKKILSFIVIAFFSLILVHTVDAEESSDYYDDIDLSKAEVIYQDEEITVTSFGNDEEIADKIENSPTAVTSESSNVLNSGGFSTMGSAKVDGPGGRATLDSSDSRRAIYWSVTPKTKWPYYFRGEIQLRYYSGFKRDAFIQGAGAIGSRSSGMITMNKNNGGRASLVGIAAAANNRLYTTMPNISIAF